MAKDIDWEVEPTFENLLTENAELRAKLAELAKLREDNRTAGIDMRSLIADNARLRAEQDNAGFIPWRLAQDAIDELRLGAAELTRLRADRDSWRILAERANAERDRLSEPSMGWLTRLWYSLRGTDA